MMQELNIIGDIAGQFDTLQALLAKMPKKGIPVSVGDMIDRGPQSKEVVTFFKEGMAKKQAIALMGNHEHMMVDWVMDYGYYNYKNWSENGGVYTIASYMDLPMGGSSKHHVEICKVKAALRPDARWMEALPLYVIKQGLIVSHAPLRPTHPKWASTDFEGVGELVWNRAEAEFRLGTLQVHGHNSGLAVVIHKDMDKTWAINLDSSRGKILTGVHWPSLEIFYQEYIR